MAVLLHHFKYNPLPKRTAFTSRTVNMASFIHHDARGRVGPIGA